MVKNRDALDDNEAQGSWFLVRTTASSGGRRPRLLAGNGMHFCRCTVHPCPGIARKPARYPPSNHAQRGVVQVLGMAHGPAVYLLPTRFDG